MRSHFVSHNSFAVLCYCEKANLCSLLDSGRQICYWLKLTMPSPQVQPWVRGRSAGSFPEQRLVIEPRHMHAPAKIKRECHLGVLTGMWIFLHLTVHRTTNSRKPHRSKFERKIPDHTRRGFVRHVEHSHYVTFFHFFRFSVAALSLAVIKISLKGKR